MFTCALCGGNGEAEYTDFITMETGVDTCPDCKGLGVTQTDNKTLQSLAETTKILSN